jgi:hypothetical protein
MDNRFRFAALLCVAMAAQAQNHPGANFDEGKVPSYTLPDPLVLAGGQPVRDAKTWTSRRRPEILELYRSEMFGRSASSSRKLNYEVTSEDRQALGGKAVRKQITIYFSDKSDGPRMEVLLYLPAAARKAAPVFVALGFAGNQTVTSDPGIPLGNEWVMDRESKKYSRRKATEESRGRAAQQWQVEQILAHGYGLATVYAGDIEPDFNGGLPYGIRPLFYKNGQTAPAADDWGALGAWAWGLSRVMDYLEKDRDVDAKRVGVFGHSRMGKTALWAGAQDTRFSLVISNESGEGGAAIARRDYGERTKDLNEHFPYWFCGNFKKYNDREDALPVDSHMLLALIAPRPLYVASAEGDQWSDPKGEFLGALKASPVYELFGRHGIAEQPMPGLRTPVGDSVRYHIRDGKHDVTAYDWEQYLKFADTQWTR